MKLSSVYQMLTAFVSLESTAEIKMCQSLTQYKKDMRLKLIVLDLYRIPENYIGLLNSQYASWALCRA